jgi:FAD/FMN-containing dehydrogenase
MAVDNVLQFTGVRANGSSFTASACQNQDLFWALRGGGGGTFAVLTSATYALHANDPATGVAGLQLSVQLLRGVQSAAAMLNAWMYELAHNWGNASNAYGVVGSGYFSVRVDATPGATDSGFECTMVFNGTASAAGAALGPIQAFAAANPLDIKVLSATLTPFSSMLAWHRSWDPSSESTGGVSILGSRLVPTSAMAADATRLALAVNLSAIATIVTVEGLMVAGGAVASSDADGSATSLGPAWRAAGLHVVLGGGFALNATLQEQNQVVQGISSLTQVLRSGLPGSGAYWSESDVLEPQWQSSFWGSKYARLQAIKAKEDPTGLFSCHHCVE